MVKGRGDDERWPVVEGLNYALDTGRGFELPTAMGRVMTVMKCPMTTDRGSKYPTLVVEVVTVLNCNGGEVEG